MPAGLGEKYWRGGQAGGQAGGRPLPPPKQDQLVSTAPPAGLGRFHASGGGGYPLEMTSWSLSDCPLDWVVLDNGEGAITPLPTLE